MEQILLTVEQAARTLAISRTRVFALIGSGELESIKLGGSRRIPRDAIQRFVDTQVSEQSVA